jgi:hypothetical protein
MIRRHELSTREGQRKRLESRERLRLRPHAETLEVRRLLSGGVTYHGGNLLPLVQVEMVYYGSVWGSGPALEQRVQQLNNYMSMMLGSKFMTSVLGEYYQNPYPSVGVPIRYVGPGTLAASVYTTNSVWSGEVLQDDITSVINNDDYRPPMGDIEHLIAGQINAGGLMQPSLDNLYVVVLPPGVYSAFCKDTQSAGFHSSFFQATGTVNGVATGNRVHYAVIAWPQTDWGITQQLQGNTLAVQTTVISHELAEAVTDPEYYQLGNSDFFPPGYGGWFQSDTGGPEIGDLAEGYYGLYNGYVIQAIWSNDVGGPVLPPGATWLTAGLGQGYWPSVATEDYVDGGFQGPTAGAASYTFAGDATTVSSSNGLLNASSDPYNNPLTTAVTQGPKDGQLKLNTDGTFTYTADLGFSGTDSFTYQVSDGTFISSPATVTLKVLAPPVTHPASYWNLVGFPLVIPASNGVLSVDSDPNGRAMTATVSAGPAHGRLQLNPDGSFTYTANPGFLGTDSFAYVATDGLASSAPASVTIKMVQPPVTHPTSYRNLVGFPLVIPASNGVLAVDSDPNGRAMTATLSTGPAHGRLQLSPDGSFTYTANPGFLGTDSFTYVANDGLASSNTARVEITVTPASPPVAADHAYTIGAGQTLHVQAPGILGGDSDPSGLPFSIQAHGSPRFGFLTLKSDGSFDYTPFASFSGTDSFVYSIGDGAGPTAWATVLITVRPQPEPQLPHVLGIVGSSRSRRGLTSIDVIFDEALNAVSAQDGDYGLFLGVKKRNHVVFNKKLGTKSVQYDSNTHTVAINLSRPVKGEVKVIVHGGIVGANGAISSGDVSSVVR